MFRHPRYLQIPWDIHWDENKPKLHRHLLLTVVLTLLALGLIGFGIISGLL